MTSEALKKIETFINSVETLSQMPFVEQTSVLVYAATCIAGEPSITGAALDKLRAHVKLLPGNSSTYLTVGSKGKARRFLKRPRGYVLTRAEEARVSGFATDPRSVPSRPKTPRAVVLTALPVEFNAVNALLQDVEEVTHPAGTIYNKGTLVSDDKSWEVYLVEIGAGNNRAAVEGERAVNHFEPDVALFIGVAGGVKDVELGDVVIATKVYGYESGKATAKSFQPRPDVARSSYRLEQRARAEARKSEWRSRAALLGVEADLPKVHVGPIAAGEKVVSSNRAEIATFIRQWYSDALAVEMEGRGFLEATHSNSLDAAVIRGISDLLSNKSVADRAGWQKRAAQRAAAFAMNLLIQFSPPRFAAA